MVYEEICIKDRLGRTVVLRNARPEDAADLIEYLKITSAETPYLIREPDEITITEEKEKQFIQAKMDDERELMLVAFIDGKHIGNCSLMRIAPYKSPPSKIERRDSEHRYGVMADGMFIPVCEYGCNGSDPEFHLTGRIRSFLIHRTMLRPLGIMRSSSSVTPPRRTMRRP